MKKFEVILVEKVAYQSIEIEAEDRDQADEMAQEIDWDEESVVGAIISRDYEIEEAK